MAKLIENKSHVQNKKGDQYDRKIKFYYGGMTFF